MAEFLSVKGIAKKLINRGDFASNDRGKLGEISDCLEEGLQEVPVLLEYNAADAVTVISNTLKKPDNVSLIVVNLPLGECEVLCRGGDPGVVGDPCLKAMALNLSDSSGGS